MTMLERFPSSDQATPGDWLWPRDIIAELGRPKTNATSAGVSRALSRLRERGLVARTGERSFRYLRMAFTKGEQ